MTDANKTPENGLETPNVPKAVSHAEALPTVIEDFVESRMAHFKKSELFYRSVMDKKYRKTTFIEELEYFIQLRKDFPGYKQLAGNKEFSNYLKNHENLLKQLQNRVRIAGFYIEQTYQTATDAIAYTYGITDKKSLEQIRAEVRDESIDKLKRRIKSNDFSDIASRIIGEKEVKMRSEQVLDEIERYFGSLALLSFDDKTALFDILHHGIIPDAGVKTLLKKLDPK